MSLSRCVLLSGYAAFRAWWACRTLTSHESQKVVTHHNSYRAMYVNLMSYTILTLVIDTWYMSIHDPNPFQTFSNRQQYDGSHVINHGFLVATTWVTNWDWSVCTPPVPPLRWHRKWPEENWTEDLGNPQPEVFRPCWVGFPILVRLPFGGWLIGCKNCLGGWKQLHFFGGESFSWLATQTHPASESMPMQGRGNFSGIPAAPSLSIWHQLCVKNMGIMSRHHTLSSNKRVVLSHQYLHPTCWGHPVLESSSSIDCTMRKLGLCLTAGNMVLQLIHSVASPSTMVEY